MKYLMFFIVITLCSCGFVSNETRQFASTLDQKTIYPTFDVSPTDLSLQSKCNSSPTIRIINDETRTEDYNVIESHPFYRTVNPKELMDSVVLYLQDGFAVSNIKSEDKSSKIIKIKMGELKSVAGVWSFGSYCKLILTIPETGFTNSYEAHDNCGEGYAAAVYAIHSATRKIIEDAEVQKYILCK